VSSTGRGGEREDLDGYYTPVRCAEAIVRMLLDDGWVRPGCSILEPSIGKGAFAATASVILDPSLLEGVDLVPRPEIADMLDMDVYVTDFVDFAPAENDVPFKYDLILGNPPYSEAEEHVRHALTLLAPGGTLALLLRINFCGGVERGKGLWTDHPPAAIYVLDRRPSFTSKKKHKRDTKTGELLYNKNGSPKMTTVSNDSTEYAVFIWRNAPAPQLLPWTLLKWMTWKPDSKRKQAKKRKGAKDFEGWTKEEIEKELEPWPKQNASPSSV
jgi:hypothetical protein